VCGRTRSRRLVFDPNQCWAIPARQQIADYLAGLAERIVIMRKMSDIVRKQDPVALPAHATVKEACRHMRHHRVGAVLVTEGDRQLVGIFTGRDAVHRVLAEGRSVDTTLAEVMTRDPDCITPGKKAIEALRLMEDRRNRHLPIVEDGKVVGIVSRFDFSGLELDRLDEETGLWERI
jgi:CBS domain-containing protein